MCGIVGYVGNKEAQPILLDCLSKLEYRGYDSCGIAIGGNSLEKYKAAVRVATLSEQSPSLQGKIGIGHTRWATHGPPNSTNAHPHFDCSGKIAVVHNGIVGNYLALKRQLINEGHRFASETDTEVISHLIEKHYNGDLLRAVETALKEVDGTYAIAVLMEGVDYLVVSRKDSPLVAGLGDGEYFIASDVPAILSYTNKIIYPEDGDIALISRDQITVMHDGHPVDREVHETHWSKSEVEKSGYDHYMLKEIHEQVRVIRDSLNEFTTRDHLDKKYSLLNADLRDLLLLACGTSYHAGLIGKYIIEELLGIPVRVEIGSEFNHRSRIIIPNAAIAITQSGETADVLIPLRKIKQAQIRTHVITNVPGSTASRLADSVVYTSAGPEVSVAATKSFIAQLMELYKMALSSDLIDAASFDDLIGEMRLLPLKVQQVLDNKIQIQNCALFMSKFDTAFFVGRGINYPIALEGALKLKEISYIHAEGYAAGELKHGPFALLDQKTPVVAIVTRSEVYDPMINNIKEIKTRHSPVIAIANFEDETIESLVDMVIRVPYVQNIFSPIVNSVALQLLAYYVARYRECPIDFPRNLAKSVTVE